MFMFQERTLHVHDTLCAPGLWYMVWVPVMNTNSLWVYDGKKNKATDLRAYKLPQENDIRG